jgi:hypothetical protein
MISVMKKAGLRNTKMHKVPITARGVVDTDSLGNSGHQGLSSGRYVFNPAVQLTAVMRNLADSST